MKPAPRQFLSRMLAVFTVLSMVAMLHAGFSAVQSNILNLQHMVSGDMQLADGGWAKACDGELDDCDGHLAPAHSGDGGPIHHHHSGGESQFGALASEQSLNTVNYLSELELKPKDTARLVGRAIATPDQPPRV